MKKSIPYPLLLLVVACTLLFTGCGIPSIHPLYEPEDLIQLDHLPGVWEDESGDRVRIYSYRQMADSAAEVNIRITDNTLEWFSTEEYDNIYLVRHLPDSGETENSGNEFIMGVLDLGGHYFMDFYPYDFSTLKDDLGGVRPFLFPVHIFRKVEIEDNRITMYDFDEGFLRSLIENRQIRIKHEVSFENFILTAQPAELKKFVLKYADESDAYRGDKDVYIKVQ